MPLAKVTIQQLVAVQVTCLLKVEEAAMLFLLNACFFPVSAPGSRSSMVELVFAAIGVASSEMPFVPSPGSGSFILDSRKQLTFVAFDGFMKLEQLSKRIKYAASTVLLQHFEQQMNSLAFCKCSELSAFCKALSEPQMRDRQAATPSLWAP